MKPVWMLGAACLLLAACATREVTATWAATEIPAVRNGETYPPVDPATRDFSRPLDTPARPFIGTNTGACPVENGEMPQWMAARYEEVTTSSDPVDVARAIARAKSMSIMRWATYGAEAMAEEPEAYFFLAYCYIDGDCKLGQDRARGIALLEAAERRELADHTLIGPHVPPNEAYKWARQNHYACSRTIPVSAYSTIADFRGRQEERRLALAPFRAEQAQADAITRQVFNASYTSEADMETELQRAINAQADAGNLDLFVNNPVFATLATSEQKGRAIMNHMKEAEVLYSINMYYGLQDYTTYYLKTFIPNVPEETYRRKLSRVISSLEARNYARGKAFAQADAIDNMLAAFGRAMEEYSAPSSSSSGNAQYNYQLQQYLYGKASRAPCTTDNPCGPNNMFRAYD